MGYDFGKFNKTQSDKSNNTDSKSESKKSNNVESKKTKDNYSVDNQDTSKKNSKKKTQKTNKKITTKEKKQQTRPENIEESNNHEKQIVEINIQDQIKKSLKQFKNEIQIEMKKEIGEMLESIGNQTLDTLIIKWQTYFIKKFSHPLNQAQHPSNFRENKYLNPHLNAFEKKALRQLARNEMYFQYWIKWIVEFYQELIKEELENESI